MSYTPTSMQPVTVTLDEADFARLSEAAARRGGSLEEAAAELMRLGLERERVIADGLAAFEQLRAQAEPLDDEEAMRIAIEEVRAMRAERAASRASFRLRPKRIPELDTSSEQRELWPGRSVMALHAVRNAFQRPNAVQCKLRWLHAVRRCTVLS